MSHAGAPLPQKAVRQASSCKAQAISHIAVNTTRYNSVSKSIKLATTSIKCFGPLGGRQGGERGGLQPRRHRSGYGRRPSLAAIAAVFVVCCALLPGEGWGVAADETESSVTTEMVVPTTTEFSKWHDGDLFDLVVEGFGFDAILCVCMCVW